MKYLKILYRFTEGHRVRYALSFVILFFAIFLLLLSSFLTKVLIDTLLFEPPSGPVDTFLTALFGGQDFLRANLWLFAVIIIGLGVSRAFMFFFTLVNSRINGC
jgi:ABC-type multidrug transport system fused ATPase/permease subunit